MSATTHKKHEKERWLLKAALIYAKNTIQHGTRPRKHITHVIHPRHLTHATKEELSQNFTQDMFALTRFERFPQKSREQSRWYRDHSQGVLAGAYFAARLDNRARIPLLKHSQMALARTKDLTLKIHFKCGASRQAGGSRHQYSQMRRAIKTIRAGGR